VDWLKGRAQEHTTGLAGLVQHIALVTMLERQQEESPDAVKLSTLHASKGLEFPHVYLIGVEEGLLPHLGREDDLMVDDEANSLASRIQEERRLMYVGITRAQRTLHLTWCARRRRARQDRVCEISRFVGEMGLTPGKPVQGEDPGISPAKRLDMLKALLSGARRTN
jgi:ATP-dependent DNA helicase Rep